MNHIAKVIAACAIALTALGTAVVADAPVEALSSCSSSYTYDPFGSRVGVVAKCTSSLGTVTRIRVGAYCYANSNGSGGSSYHFSEWETRVNRVTGFGCPTVTGGARPYIFFKQLYQST